MFLIKSISIKVGLQSHLKFQVTQHARDEKLMKSLNSYFRCGYVEKYTTGPYIDYTVSKFSDIQYKIIPFFNKNKIVGTKYLDFKDWCKIARIMQNKTHLTYKGLNKIFFIKAGMNKGRY